MQHFVDSWLLGIPPLAVYLVAGLAVGIESLGIPVPGETVLVAASLLSSRHALNVDWQWIAVAGSVGAIVGDSIGYLLGRRFGRPLFDWLGRRFPKHFSADHLAYAEHVFDRWGALAVGFGRWIAFLRIFAGPLAGALRLPYPKFFLANALGGITWATTFAAAIYYLGVVADTWFSRFSLFGLIAAVLVGLVVGLAVKKRMNRLVQDYARTRAAQRTRT